MTSNSLSLEDPTSGRSRSSPMSRTSDAASDLGRLALGSRGRTSAEMPAQTRSQVQKHEGRQSASGQPTSSTGRSSRRSGKEAAAAPSRSSQAQRSTGKQRRQEPSDDDEDDDDDDDEDEGDSDDDGNGGSGRPATSTFSTYHQMLAMNSVFEPNHMSFDEMTDERLRDRPESSTAFRNAMMASAAHNRGSGRAAAAVLAALPLEGRLWSDLTAKNIESRMSKMFDDYQREKRVFTTISEARRLFTAVEQNLRRFRNMSNNAQQRHIWALSTTMHSIIIRYQDVRASASSRVVYAGGATQHEHNLCFRFLTSRDDWRHCIETIRRLVNTGSFNQHFVASSQWWAAIFDMLRERYAQVQTDNIKDFITQLRQILEPIGVNLQTQ